MYNFVQNQINRKFYTNLCKKEACKELYFNYLSLLKETSNCIKQNACRQM